MNAPLNLSLFLFPSSLVPYDYVLHCYLRSRIGPSRYALRYASPTAKPSVIPNERKNRILHDDPSASQVEQVHLIQEGAILHESLLCKRVIPNLHTHILVVGLTLPTHVSE